MVSELGVSDLNSFNWASRRLCSANCSSRCVCDRARIKSATVRTLHSSTAHTTAHRASTFHNLGSASLLGPPRQFLGRPNPPVAYLWALRLPPPLGGEIFFMWKKFTLKFKHVWKWTTEMYPCPFQISKYATDMPSTSSNLPPPLPFYPLPFHSSFPLSPLKSKPLNAARGSGECCKLPQRDLGHNPGGNRIWCIFAVKGGINFTNFPDN